MKIQDLAIIFVIIILPISLVLSAYSQAQIQTLNLQTLYDSQLTAATYDAIKAYQINAENSSTSDLTESKIRDVEASVSTFKNSIMSSFRLNGYTEEELNNYIPALVYTMYDGFYIYSPFKNVNHRYEPQKDTDGNPLKDEDGNIIYTNELADGNGENTYGLKPYISYSCRYKVSGVDAVITYSLENYITVQGMVDGEYVNKSGYLIDGITVNADNTIKYNDTEIKAEKLREFLPIPRATDGRTPETYPYIKLNGTKYYRVDLDSKVSGDDAIIYFLNGTITVQCKSKTNPEEYKKYSDLIDKNTQAVQYYKNAEEFTRWLRRSRINDLRYEDAYDVGGTTKIWEGNITPIFKDKNNIENELSNFNQHRLAVIRHKIESNLSVAIANYNIYSGASATTDFQMPELKETEWDYIIHNISLISFLQGLNIGGKIYNGYTIVTNSESKEVVQENNIYILGSDNAYHKIGDIDLEKGITDSKQYGDSSASAGRLNLDFKRKMITNDNNVLYYYPLKEYNASYKSVVMEEDVAKYEDIYDYINNLGTEAAGLQKAFYTALGRERMAKYNINTIFNINNM